ncbi:hypothetical protein M3J07_000195 [Ascochyta lentis]
MMLTPATKCSALVGGVGSLSCGCYTD